MMTLSLMMCGFATFGKHRIIANEMSGIIFAKQIHHIAKAIHLKACGIGILSTFSLAL